MSEFARSEQERNAGGWVRRPIETVPLRDEEPLPIAELQALPRTEYIAASGSSIAVRALRRILPIIDPEVNRSKECRLSREGRPVFYDVSVRRSGDVRKRRRSGIYVGSAESSLFSYSSRPLPKRSPKDAVFNARSEDPEQ